MANRLYIVHGIGNDGVGLVGKITASIAQAKGNIVDLRQDVMHGLFSIYLVVDLSASTLSLEAFQEVLQGISDETGLKISIDKFTPVARSAEKTAMLLILVGRDKPGIIATVSKALSSYNINIEFSQMIAREDIFLMDLLVDISKSVLPLDNLKTVLREKMDALGIKTMFQTRDVFNKQKKIILFDIASSFIGRETLDEILGQARIARADLDAVYDVRKVSSSLQAAVGYLEDLPVAVLNAVIDAIEIDPTTVELMQTLKIMGYKIGLVSTGFDLFTDSLKQKLDIDYSFGAALPIDDDAQVVAGGITADDLKVPDRAGIIAQLKQREAVADEDITVISDLALDTPALPGISLTFNMKILLDYLNQHVLNRETMLGLLGGFGIPHDR